MNLEQICEELIKIFPMYKERLNNHINEYDGDLLGHVFFGEDFNLNLIDLLKIDLSRLTETLISGSFNREVLSMIKNDKEITKKHCNFVELMWLKGDEYVKNLVDVTILERLSDDREIWKRFGYYISSEFKDYINEDLLKRNNMMYHVNRL